jgi:hypothetical protein
MMVQTEAAARICPHCWGKTICDCHTCGLKVRILVFSGKWHTYYESGVCRVCGGRGTIPGSG